MAIDQIREGALVAVACLHHEYRFVHRCSRSIKRLRTGDRYATGAKTCAVFEIQLIEHCAHAALTGGSRPRRDVHYHRRDRRNRPRRGRRRARLNRRAATSDRRRHAGPRGLPTQHHRRRGRPDVGRHRLDRFRDTRRLRPVSYTHLTLPTSDLV